MNEAGFVTVAAVMNSDECLAIIEQAHALFGDSTNRHPRDKPASGTRHLEELGQRVPLVADLLARPALASAIEETLGTHATPVQVSLRSPQPGYGGQDLHRDTAESLQGPRPTALTAIIPLVDFTAENGATRVVPGSHLTNEPASNYRGRRRSEGEVLLTGRAGTAFVFTAHLLHSGTQNDSTTARPALQILWR